MVIWVLPCGEVNSTNYKQLWCIYILGGLVGNIYDRRHSSDLGNARVERFYR